MTVSPVSLYFENDEERERRGEQDQDPAGGRRAPLLRRGAAGPSSRICWPNSLRRRNAMKRGPAKIETTPATMPAMRTRRHAVTPASASATRSRPSTRAPLTSTQSPGSSSRAHERQRLVGVRRVTAPVHARALADRDEHVDADLRDRPRDLVGAPRRCSRRARPSRRGRRRAGGRRRGRAGARALRASRAGSRSRRR